MQYTRERELDNSLNAKVQHKDSTPSGQQSPIFARKQPQHEKILSDCNVQEENAAGYTPVKPVRRHAERREDKSNAKRVTEISQRSKRAGCR